MKKQYIKPFVNVHTLKVETMLQSNSIFDVVALDNDQTLVEEEESQTTGVGNFGIDYHYKPGNGDNDKYPVN